MFNLITSVGLSLLCQVFKSSCICFYEWPFSNLREGQNAWGDILLHHYYFLSVHITVIEALLLSEGDSLKSTLNVSTKHNGQPHLSLEVPTCSNISILHCLAFCGQQNKTFIVQRNMFPRCASANNP